MKTPLPPLGTKFTLGPSITAEQRAYLEEHGYLHFEGVLRDAEVASVREEIDRVEKQWLAEGRTRVNGIPLFFGARADGSKGIQRFAFTSLFSDVIGQLVRDARFLPVRSLVGSDVRVGEREKDGVVVNRFLNVPGSSTPRLGWHTDGLRDLFYLRMPQAMLNVGLHLDDCPAENGGLRLLPGTHRQGFFSMCFRKPYFVWHRRDPGELVVETKPGDLTVHDGRLWHRVAKSERTGPASLRRSMYVPYLTGPYEPKTEASPTPGYHRLGKLLRAIKQRRTAIGIAVLAVFATLFFSKSAFAAGYWNFDKGVSNFGRGGANVAAPSDPIAVYTNPAALSGLTGFRFVVDADAAWDDRRFERRADRLGQPRSAHRPAYEGVENDWPELPPSPGFFASWNAAAIGVPRLTIGGGLYGPPRADTRFPADGPQRYQLIESHNLQIHRALSVAYELPWKKARVGVTGMSINQIIRTRLAFNTFMGMPEDPGWDADMRVKARDNDIYTAAFGGSIAPISRLTLAASGQLPYDVKAKGQVKGEIGEALEQKADLKEGGVTVKTKLPAIARGAVRWDESQWNVETVFVYETWGRNDEVVFLPDQPGGLGLKDEETGLTVKIKEVRLKTHLRDTWSLRLGGERVVNERLTARAGVFYERAAVAPSRLSASNFDLDKTGVTVGTPHPAPQGVLARLRRGLLVVEARRERLQQGAARGPDREGDALALGQRPLLEFAWRPDDGAGHRALRCGTVPRIFREGACRSSASRCSFPPRCSRLSGRTPPACGTSTRAPRTTRAAARTSPRRPIPRPSI
jgi:phytanoyl-CoA hydroxylase